MRPEEHEKLVKTIRKELDECLMEFQLRLNEDLKDNIDALKVNTEVGTQAIRKLDEIKNQLEK